MKCERCGLISDDKVFYCKRCGAQLRKRETIKAEEIGDAHFNSADSLRVSKRNGALRNTLLTLIGMVAVIAVATAAGIVFLLQVDKNVRMKSQQIIQGVNAGEVCELMPDDIVASREGLEKELLLELPTLLV